MYLEASEKVNKSGKAKIPFLLNLMRNQGIAVFNTFIFREKKKKIIQKKFY